MPRPRKAPHVQLYRGTYHAYVDRDRRRVPLHTTDSIEAQARLADLLQRERPRPARSGAATLAKLSADVLDAATHRNTPKTKYELGRNLVRVVTWLEGEGADYAEGVTQAVVDRYVAFRREGPAKVTATRVNRELDSLRRLLRHAEGLGEVPEGYAARAVKKLREPRPKPHQRGLTRAEITRFLKKVDRRYAPLCRGVLGSNLRDEELRHLQPGDVDRKKLTVTVGPKDPGACDCCPGGWTSKGYRYREIPISKATADALLAYLSTRDEVNLDKKRVWEVIQAGCASAKVKPPFSLHDLRKAWASHLLAKLGAGSLQRISQWLGHADIITTMRYLNIVEGELPARAQLPF